MHLKILKFGESYFVEDLSTNGTYISNKKVQFGLYKFIYLDWKRKLIKIRKWRYYLSASPV